MRLVGLIFYCLFTVIVYTKERTITHITPAATGVIFQIFPRYLGKVDNNFDCKARGIVMKIMLTCFSTRGFFDITLSVPTCVLLSARANSF